MTLSLEQKKHKPPRILIYAAHGVGKSTFGSLADRPVFIQTEDGLDAIDCAAFPLAKSYDAFMGYIGELCSTEHDFKTLVIDSLDWLEPLVWAKLIQERPHGEKGQVIKSIEDYGYGKGYNMVMDYWDEYIRAINYLRDNKDMMIIQIAHAQIRKFENPETDIYDRYEIKLHKAASAKIQEHSDMVLFANYATAVKKEDKGFGGERKRAIGSGERVIYTEERPAFVAKNRYSLPSEIPFDKQGNYWATIAQNIPYFSKQKGKQNG